MVGRPCASRIRGGWATRRCGGELRTVPRAQNPPRFTRNQADGCIQVDLNAYGGGMDTFQIAELARRTGFSPPTLRYYEEIGLLEEPERSESGYRIYGRDDETRLQFIRRAKRLGLTLAEIRDLVAVWTGGQCATTRRQLHELVNRKVTAIREQIEQSVTFLRQLEAVSDRLTREPEVSDGCECAPELPHINVVHLRQGLSALETDGCSCGGACDRACSCGCACCGDDAERSDTRDTMDERRDRREHQRA